MARNEFNPKSITHPGVTLSEKLEEIGMGPKEFAIRTGKPEKTIIAVLQGESNVTPEMAAQFENVLKIPAHFWLNYQAKYNELLATQKKLVAIEDSTSWASKFPYAAMAKLGWVPVTRNLMEKTDHLLDFFSVFDHKAWSNLYFEKKLLVEFRISLKHTREPYAIAAWLRQGEMLAGKFHIPPYDANKFRESLPKVKQLMAEHPPDFFIKLQGLCFKAGVKVVYTPCLPKAPVHGSSRWLGDTPLIQLSARYKQNDRFWFTFFHEAGHILLHGKKYISIENIDLPDELDHYEIEANEFSIKWTFSEEQEQEVVSSFPIVESDVISFARKFKTHPAMIIGRLQHKNYIPYSLGRKFIQSVNLTDTSANEKN